MHIRMSAVPPYEIPVSAQRHRLLQSNSSKADERNRPIETSTVTPTTSPSHSSENLSIHQKEELEQQRRAAETLMALGAGCGATPKKSTKAPRQVFQEVTNTRLSSQHHKVTPQRADDPTVLRHSHVVHEDQREGQDEASWWANVRALQAFRHQNGHYSVYSAHPLFAWVKAQRFLYFYMRIVGGTPLIAQRCGVLANLGFPFIQGEWYQRLDQFLSVQQCYGRHVNLDQGHYMRASGLEAWVNSQRNFCRSLSKEQITLLIECGALDKTQRVVATFQDAVPTVIQQKEIISSDNSSKEPRNETEASESADDSWGSSRSRVQWGDKFELLCAFQKKHGHCHVRRSNPVLGRWVATQRVQYNLMRTGRHHYMDDERVQRLNSIGFIWDLSPDTRWNARFQELLQYKKKFGDCLVPQRSADYPSLGSWVAGQRQLYKAGRTSVLTNARIRLLDQAGFVWHCRDSKSKTNGCQSHSD